MMALLAWWLMASAAAAPSQKANIIFVLTDDQDIELGGVTPNTKVRKLLGEQGAVGEAFYVNTPICCPSRSEYLSGRMYHNVLNGDLSGCMHVDDKFAIFNDSFSVFPLLQSAGYRTGAFGKVINGQKNFFCKAGVPPVVNGFDWVSVPCNEGDFFTNIFFNKIDNGSHWQESLGAPADVNASWYQTAQIGNRSIEFIRDSVAMRKPFFAYLGPHAPHYSADAPPWAQNLFDGLGAPRTPAYNTSIGQADKTKAVAQNPPITDEMATWIDAHFRDRWRSIVGVDDMVGLVIAELERLQILDNTFVFYSSDHGCAERVTCRISEPCVGTRSPAAELTRLYDARLDRYKLGEWRIGCSKQHPYESDVHIPFFARGPGIAPGTRMTASEQSPPTLAHHQVPSQCFQQALFWCVSQWASTSTSRPPSSTSLASSRALNTTASPCCRCSLRALSHSWLRQSRGSCSGAAAKSLST
jgi:N-acetylglucosamine-6-sulfatase